MATMPMAESLVREWDRLKDSTERGKSAKFSELEQNFVD